MPTVKLAGPCLQQSQKAVPQDKTRLGHPVALDDEAASTPVRSLARRPALPAYGFTTVICVQSYMRERNFSAAGVIFELAGRLFR
jgi:hypothetical protein